MNFTFNKQVSCSGVFWYESEGEGGNDEDEDGVEADVHKNKLLSRSFRNIKTHLKTHFLSEKHKKAVNIKREKEISEKSTNTEIEIGMRIARICYYLYTNARPFTDFENLLLLQHLNDTKIGNINHSRMFPIYFLNSVAFVVQQLKIKLRIYLTKK